MSKTVLELIGQARARVGAVSAADAAAELAAGTTVLVDVRQAGEWEHGHIEGSVAASRGLLEFYADPTSPRHKPELDPDRRVVVVCRSGARAFLAAASLQDMGYRDVAVLEGGLVEWQAAGLPVTDDEYAET